MDFTDSQFKSSFQKKAKQLREEKTPTAENEPEQPKTFASFWPSQA
jgi:hypothetical protein